MRYLIFIALLSLGFSSSIYGQVSESCIDTYSTTHTYSNDDYSNLGGVILYDNSLSSNICDGGYINETGELITINSVTYESTYDIVVHYPDLSQVHLDVEFIDIEFHCDATFSEILCNPITGGSPTFTQYQFNYAYSSVKMYLVYDWYQDEPEGNWQLMLAESTFTEGDFLLDSQQLSEEHLGRLEETIQPANSTISDILYTRMLNAIEEFVVPEIEDSSPDCHEWCSLYGLVYDECGICNGSGIPDGDCDCEGNILDECGTCGGSGIPEGECDCDGNVLDACGTCGGAGIPEGECDCDGNVLDECGTCGGAGIPEGECDCDGNGLDALGVCGGACEADADSDGVCDDVDDCVGEYDECGVCNGLGAVYDCGCSSIPEGECDCDGNVDDVVGVCGGTCEADVNLNSICDTEEFGCTDSDNPNYDPTAAFDDGSCIEGGCTFPAACNYDPDADYQLLGSCDFTSCAGCTNLNACNYDMTFTIDDGSCEFASFGYDCEGSCLNDDDSDGICNEFEVLGCTETGNPNFNPYATDDDGSCLSGGCNIPAACNFDPSADYLIASSCDFVSCIGCADLAACNYDANALIPDLTLCEYPLSIFFDCNGVCNNDTDADGICDENEIPGCTDETASNYNPEATNDNGTCQAALVGGCILPFACNYNPEANFYLPGSCDFAPCGGMPPMDLCTQAEACNYGSEGPCDFMSCLSLGCNSLGACNYDETSQYNDGSCEYLSCLGCRNPLACDYDPEATIDGACYDFNTCVGCLDSNANNFDPEATQGGETCLYEGCVIQEACNYDQNANSNDGSCEFSSCSGCLNEIACNYEPEAFISGDCSFAPIGFDCDGNGTQFGCTDTCACNFNSSANAENGTCDYGCLGCVYPTADNYNEAASRDDGSCIFTGCIDEDYANYNPVANATSECSHAPASADFDGDGSVQISDLTTFLQAYSQIGPDWGGLDWVIESCEVDAYEDADILAWMLGVAGTPEVNTCGMAGCAYPGAINFNPEATFDTGSCVFAGCTDTEAFNFDRLATVDNGSCNYSVCPDFNGDGEVQISDLMDFLIQWGNIE